MLKWYQASLAKRPVLTQAAMSFVLFGTGDFLAQQAVEKKGLKKHEWARTGRMALYGGAVFGPAATKWYQFLQKKIKFPSKNTTAAVTVVTDQSVFATINLGVFLSTMALLEGGSPEEKLRKSYLPALKYNWMIWPAVQFINFKFVPLEHRVLIVNIVSLGWNCILSYINSSK